MTIKPLQLNSAVVQPRMTLRVGTGSLMMAVPDETLPEQVACETYVMKSGVSTAANLREAFKSAALLSVGYRRAVVLVNSPVLMLPMDEFKEEEKEKLYRFAFTEVGNDLFSHNLLPSLNAVAVYPVNKDLNLVLTDNFADVKYGHVMQPMWKYFHHRSGYGQYRRLYAYFHDRKLDLFSFDKKRFKFCNAFDTENSRDSLFFMLHAWQQLALDPLRDEFYLVGNVPDEKWLVAAVRRYVKKVFVVSASAEFNRAPVTNIKTMPFDLMTFMIMGR